MFILLHNNQIRMYNENITNVDKKYSKLKKKPKQNTNPRNQY